MHAQDRILAFAFTAVAVLALALVGRSLLLIYDLARPIPYWDAWEFMKALPAITTGRYTPADLVGFHNEHRIVTTRLLMLADLRLFDQSGILPMAVLVLALCLIGGLLGLVAGGVGWAGAGLAAVAVSLMLSVAQWENFASGFQVQFPLVDLFAVAAIGLFVLASRHPHRSWPLLAAAVAADALAIGSMASGNVVVAPVLVVGLLLRAPWLRIAAFAVPSLALSAAYAVHYPRAPMPPSHDVVGIAHFALAYLGSTLRGFPGASTPLGAALLLAYGANLAALVRGRWMQAPVDPVSAWLAGIGAFAICGALVTATGRLPYGMETATSSRYAIQSLLFACCVLLMSVRAAAARRRSAEAGLGLAVAALALSAASTLAPEPLAEWRARVADYDVAGSALASGVLSDEAIAGVYPYPEMVRAPIRFMAAHRLGPFSVRYAAVYRPPTNAIGSVEGPLPGCIGIADSVKVVGPDWLQVNGWAVDGANPGQDGWVLVYDGDRHLLGFGRQSGSRPDAAASVPVAPTRLGYHVLVNLSAADRATTRSAVLILVPKGAAGDACRFNLSLDGAG